MKSGFLLDLEGLTPELSQSLKNELIYVPSSQIPTSKEGSYYHFQLIGLKVIDEDNNLLGNIISIDNFGAGDLIEVKKTNNKSFYIPMNEDNIVTFSALK